MDYANICFVVMPFELKDWGSRKVNFDMLFAEIFAPAILAPGLPEGGKLEPHRTDIAAASAGLCQTSENSQWTTFLSILELLRPAAKELAGLEILMRINALAS